jgi:hypothetical protein
VLPCPPRAPAPLPPLRLSATGVGVSTSRGEPAPITLFFLLRRRQVLCGRRAREPLMLAQPVLLTLLLPALPPPDAPLLPACSPLLLPSLHRARGRLGSGRGRVRLRDIYSHPLLKMIVKTAPVRCERVRREGRPTHCRRVGEHNKRPDVVVAVPDDLEANGAPHSRGRIFQREALRKELRARQ